ncbi:Methyl-accepting chemotaxis protein [Magnetospirillum sp. SS-4]|nr:Methyl-accepting chemotaxis protein [Magnetospirillum sp. SS-4]
MGQIMQSKLHGAEGKAIAAAEIVAAMPVVKKAFAARDRAQLLAATQDAYQVQHEKYGISQAQFHLAPAVSFLRVHRPDRFGDDLSKARQMVVEVNRSNGIRKGIEITSTGIGVFGTMPVADEAGKPIGSFEMGFEIEPLLEEIKKAYGFEVGFFVDEKILRETATHIKGDIFSDQKRVGSFVRFSSTHPDLLKALVTDGVINVTEQTHYLHEVNGVPYGVLLQPVYDYAKKPIGVMAIAADFTDTRSADGQAVVWQILLALVSGVLQIGVILVMVRGKILRPLEVLNERVAALADGAEGRDLPEALCGEMQVLAESCERLAARAAGEAGKGDAP